MRDYEVVEPFPFDLGANLEFVNWYDGKKVYKAVTVPDPKRSARWSISTFRGGWCYGAVHWYGSLKVYGLSVKILEVYDEGCHHKPGDVFGTNFLTETMERCPDLKWVNGWEVEVTTVVEEDEPPRPERRSGCCSRRAATRTGSRISPCSGGALRRSSTACSHRLGE